MFGFGYDYFIWVNIIIWVNFLNSVVIRMEMGYFVGVGMCFFKGEKSCVMFSFLGFWIRA